MARLKHRKSKELHNLASTHMVGRAPRSDLLLANRQASGTHAEIRWSGSCWELRDLASRNGTFVNDHKLEKGGRVPIRRGNKLAFGDRKDVFVLVDDGPPQAVAIRDDGHHQGPEDGLLVLPDAEHPVLTIFDEGNGVWIAENNEGVRQRIANGDTLTVEGRQWRIELPLVPEHTLEAGSQQLMLHALTLRFAVSRDEEEVEVTLVQNDMVKKLQPVAYHYLLLTLARLRLEDQDSGKDEDEVGWVEVKELLDMLKFEESTLNVYVCRARQRFARAEVYGAAELIERRPRWLRLGVRNVEISTL